MHRTFKIAIFLTFVFTMVMTASYRPAKRYCVSWKRGNGAATRSMWQSVAKKVSSAVSRLTDRTMNIYSHVKKISGHFRFPVFQKLCASLGKDIEVLEQDQSIQPGTTGIGRRIKLALKKFSVEWHFPWYRYCGPNTNLKLRLYRDDKGINMLDEACKEHDAGYLTYPDFQSRIAIDRTLALKAYGRMKAVNASVGEKAAAWIVVAAMCSKLQVTTNVNSFFRRKKQNNQK